MYTFRHNITFPTGHKNAGDFEYKHERAIRPKCQYYLELILLYSETYVHAHLIFVTTITTANCVKKMQSMKFSNWKAKTTALYTV